MRTSDHCNPDAPPLYNRYPVLPDAQPYDDAPLAGGESYVINFKFFPTTEWGRIDPCSWKASMTVRARDLRRLMREGFFRTQRHASQVYGGV